MNTRDKILDKSLQMFNERGIEYVGLRELAAVLQIRVGNITYYFPTKDDLVYALSQQLSEENSKIILDDEDTTMESFLNMLRSVFENHYRFRCLLRSFVHVMTQNKIVMHSYAKIKEQRGSTISAIINRLSASGYLTVQDEAILDFLVSTIELVSRYWISEVAVFNKVAGKHEQIQHYLLMICNLLQPYSSSKSKKAITAFLEKKY